MAEEEILAEALVKQQEAAKAKKAVTAMKARGHPCENSGQASTIELSANAPGFDIIIEDALSISAPASKNIQSTYANS